MSRCKVNLNHAWIDDDGNFPIADFPIAGSRDNSLAGPDRVTSVYFRDLDKHLIDHINQADAVLGCVAWLTNGSILDALSRKSVVSIVVQKEDFLRPDTGNLKDWKNWLRRKYDSLKCDVDRYSFDNNIISHLSICSDPTIDPIRCAGNYNRDRMPAFPRMHNKFMVFAEIVQSFDEEPSLNPYAVWTGSFNLTENSCSSLENALFITDPEIVQAYYKEFGQIVAISEELDWETDWMAPQWRIGT